jgi:hypothetical protein
MDNLDFEEFEESNFEEDVLNELAREFESKVLVAIKSHVKEYYEQIQKENIELTKTVQEYRTKEREISDLKYLLNQEKQDLESNFLRMKFKEATKDLFGICWGVEIKYTKKEKCNLCDGSRKITYTAINGNSIQADCECAKTICTYYPIKLELFDLDITKSNSQPFSLVARFSNISNTYKDNQLETVSFKNNNKIRDKFDPLITHYPNIYSTLEECQKHCDYNNNKKEGKE